ADLFEGVDGGQEGPTLGHAFLARPVILLGGPLPEGVSPHGQADDGGRPAQRPSDRGGQGGDAHGGDGADRGDGRDGAGNTAPDPDQSPDGTDQLLGHP